MTTTETEYSYVCTTEPECLCADEGSDECGCMPDDRERLATTCHNCDAPMHAIDFETGEDLPEGATSSFTGVS